jgi:hypothetical protein
MSERKKPRRFQRSRSKGSRLPKGVVCVTRPGRWCNPYPVGVQYRYGGFVCLTAEQALQHFREYAEERMQSEPEWLAPIRGKDLACFCALGALCHADILLELANR